MNAAPHIIDNTKTLKMYSSKAMGIATFLGGPLAGAYMMGENFKAMGKPREGQISLVSGIVFTLLLFTFLFLAPENVIDRVPQQLIPGIYTLIFYFLVDHYQGEALKQYKAEEKPFYSGWRAAGIGLLSAIISLSVVFGFVAMEPDEEYFAQYNAELALFTQNEESTLSIYDNLSTKSRESLLFRLDKQVIPKWEENMQIIGRMQQLEDLPSELIRQNEILETYTKLRIRGLHTLRKAIDEDTDMYNMQLEGFARKIDEQLLLLSER